MIDWKDVVVRPIDDERTIVMAQFTYKDFKVITTKTSYNDADHYESEVRHKYFNNGDPIVLAEADDPVDAEFQHKWFVSRLLWDEVASDAGFASTLQLRDVLTNEVFQREGSELFG